MSEGTFGKDCKELCGYCHSGMCEFVTGKCPNGYADGFQRPFCAESKSSV